MITISLLKMKSDQMLTYCLGGRHHTKSNDFSEFEKLKPKTNKIVKNFNGS